MGEIVIVKSMLIEEIAVGMRFISEEVAVDYNFSTNNLYSNLHNYLTVGRGYKRHRDGFFL